MYIDFDEYPCYSGRIYIQCVHGYAYSSGKQKMYTWVNEDSWGIFVQISQQKTHIQAYIRTQKRTRIYTEK